MLDQILINLVVNARDAMPRGGKLTIRAARVHLDDDYHHKHPESRPGHFAQLTVTDTGCGIASEHLPRIFEPFFTTKEVGKGTGLGLATVHGIVQQHEGWIEVDSQIGSGTTFRVYLPLSEITTDKNQHAKKLSTLPGGSETILLVEDEPALLTLVSRVLRHHGYEILEAKSGVAALELWKKHSASIHLLFTDIVMPHGVSGIALANQFQTERPSLKVLLTSGYSQELSQSPPSEAIKWPILEKPCAPWRILEAVRQTLDK